VLCARPVLPSTPWPMPRNCLEASVVTGERLLQARAPPERDDDARSCYQAPAVNVHSFDLVLHYAPQALPATKSSFLEPFFLFPFQLERALSILHQPSPSATGIAAAIPLHPCPDSREC
jgi:hypothetical protein